MSGKEIDIARRLESHRSSINLIEPLICDVRCKIPIPDELYYNILIAATEAVNNAIIHGNKLNPEKYVLLHIHACDCEIVITVVDEGPGFDYSHVQDPRLPQNLMKDGGRGVFLMRQLSSSAEFFDGGRGIKMIFSL